jgi:hypothetical protein
MELATLQAGIIINAGMKNGGTVTATIVAGSSELNAAQKPTSVTFTGTQNTIKLAPKAPPGWGGGTIIPTAAPGLRVCRIRLTNTVDFGVVNPNFVFNFTASPYNTVVSCYDVSTGVNIAITAAANHTVTTMFNPLLNGAITAFNVTGTGAYCTGGTGLPVGLDGSQTGGVKYLLAKGGSSTGNWYTPGTGAALTFGTQLAETYTVKGHRTATYMNLDMTGSAVITENPPVAATLAPMGPYCQGSAPVALPGSSLNGFTGTWMPAAINTAAAGTTNYVFTPDAGQCATGASIDITINAPVLATFAQLGPYVQGSAPDALPAMSIEGITGTWLPAAISTATVGTSTYAFTPDGGQCATGTTMDVQITPGGPVDYTWNGVNTMWTMPTNWTPNGVPGAIDNVLIPAGFGLNYPEIMAATTVNNITILTGGALMGNGLLTVNGTATVNSNLDGSGYHYISTPVTGATAISALPGSTYLRKYNEPTGMWQNMTGADMLMAGTGYSSQIAGGAVATYSGTLNSGPVSPAGLTNLGASGNPMYDGYNLIGNPFCSPINLDAGIVWGGVAPIAYFWNSALNDYGVYTVGGGAGTNGASKYVPVGQGFFVKATGGAPIVTFSEGSRTFQSNAFLKNSIDNIIRMKVEGGQFSDEALVLFNESATAALDNDLDAFKLKASEVNHLYTKSTESYDLAINTLTSPEVNVVVPVYLEVAQSGNYTFTASDLETFTYNLPIWLTDLKTGYSQNLLINPVYSFNAETADNAARFKLSFGSVGIQDPNTANIGIYAERKNVHVTTPDNFKGSIQVYDILGKMVAERSVSGAGENIINLNVAGATYLVKVTNAQSSITRKVVLN